MLTKYNHTYSDTNNNIIIRILEHISTYSNPNNSINILIIVQITLISGKW